ncbi:serine/threonine-protein phosphatase [Herbidospora galbida]|uniref:Serine/threonine-protein phosphatase n=1 Tax=Herbidospora galbida TaxID=2575442 RepID=A0A4U3MNV2_9ACTN|nr:protein phosphatase 2C domain-containing protein [Herbidospora galbida]TKK90362.1 serine/threonine-protein phosphatase [Herbidospora galbida]
MSLIVTAAARTHVGRVRRRNEDSFYCGRSLFAVADGLGGHVAGDVASNTVIDALRPYDKETAAADLLTVLGRMVFKANQALREKVEAEPEAAGMGTTLVAMLLSGSTAALANIGDSRAYLLRDGDDADGKPEAIPITEDHVYGNLVSDADDVPNLPPKMSRFLDGRADGRSPDLNIREMQAGDRFLLCSDGLSAVVPPDLILEALRSSTDPGDAADQLVSLAVDHGGPDNITVIIIDVREA